MTSTELVASPSMLLADSRDTCLRATWHQTDRVVVLSHWRDGGCASTFQLAASDVARLTSFFVGVLGDSAASTATISVDHGTRPNLRQRLRSAAAAWRTPRS